MVCCVKRICCCNSSNPATFFEAQSLPTPTRVHGSDSEYRSSELSDSVLHKAVCGGDEVTVLKELCSGGLKELCCGGLKWRHTVPRE